MEYLLSLQVNRDTKRDLCSHQPFSQTVKINFQLKYKVN
jgi:hypothetical protein